MGWKTILSLFFILIVVFLLGAYWFIPHGTFEFAFNNKDSNFTVGNSTTGMQFYENMRFPSKEITYKIQDCPLQRNDDMLRAFDIIENETILNFKPVSNNEEIFVTCNSKTKIQGGLFIAGEGGPVNITQTQDFNVILKGNILLIRDSNCEKPNVAIHELLHVLGFNHSENKNNIMYPVSKCSQTIGVDTINFINEIYSYETLPDLGFENVSAVKQGTGIDLNMTIRNNGLKESGAAEIIFYEDGKKLDSVKLEPFGIGHGRLILLKNIFSLNKNTQILKLEISYSGAELDKDNNVANLEIKK